MRKKNRIFFWVIFLIFLSIVSLLPFLFSPYGEIRVPLLSIFFFFCGIFLTLIIFSLLFSVRDLIFLPPPSPSKTQFPFLYWAREEVRKFNQELLRELEKKEEELRKLRKNLLSLNLELIEREKLASLAKMASGVVHEIKTPLSVILTSLYLLKKKKLFLPEAEKHIKIIEEEIAKINEISDSLLKLAKSSAEVPLHWVNIKDAIEEIVEELKLSGKLENVEVKNLLPHDFPPIFANLSSLREIFQNLFLNAVEAMEGKGEIRVYGKKSGERAHVYIEDNGPGISKLDLPKVFDPFFTTKPGGTGLGLAVTYALVKGCKGDIRVESEEGRGTKFELIFPAKV